MPNRAAPPDPPTPFMRLCRLLLRLIGWRLVANPPPFDKYVAVGAWHTSNWDFVLAVLAVGGLGIPIRFIGKRELTEGRLGWLMKRLGVIGVDRSGNTGVTARIAQLYHDADALVIIVPAEGTRSATEYWRSGFYYMALAAEVPIGFAFIDARTRTLGVDGGFLPSGVLEDDLQRLRDFFGDKAGLKPRNMGPIRFRPRPTPAEGAAEIAADPAASTASAADETAAGTAGERRD